MTETAPTYERGKYLLAAGVVIFAIGQSLLFIIVAPMARSVGLTVMQFGLTFSLANLSLVFAAPYWGKLSDRIGRKPVFIVGLFGSAFGTLLMALSLRLGMSGALTTTGMIGLLFLSRAAYGATSSSIYPSASAYIADVTDAQNRGRGMALIGGANSLGSILGPAMGGGLAFLGALFPMYAAVVISIIFGIIAIFWLKEPENSKARKKDKNKKEVTLKFTDRRLRPYMIMWASFFVIFISLNFITSFFIQDRLGVADMKEVMRSASLVLAAMATVITLLQGVLFQIIHPRPRLLLMLSGPVFSVGLFIMAFSTTLPMLMLGFSILGGAFACATPGINGSASLTVAPHEQGAAAGYLAAANTSGAILGPVFGTALYNWQPQAPMLIGGAAMILLSIYAFTIPEPQQFQTPSEAT